MNLCFECVNLDNVGSLFCYIVLYVLSLISVIQNLYCLAFTKQTILSECNDHLKLSMKSLN